MIATAVSELSPRSYSRFTEATSWKEIWEAGPYYERVAALLEKTQNYAIFVGWQVDSRLPFSRGETLRDKVIRLCERNPRLHIYFLIWAHSYLYVIERQLWQTRIWENVHPRVHFVFDNHHPVGTSHHEKICVIDGETAFCGGIDLCAERWDTPAHRFEDPRRSLDGRKERHGPYHDVAVEVTGPVCRSILEHVAARWRAVSSIPLPVDLEPAPSDRAPAHPVYVSRTIVPIEPQPRRTAMVREVEFLFRDLVHAAQNRIILEGQYYWSRDFHDLLLAKITEMKGRNFELVLILAELQRVRSFSRNMARYQLEMIRELQLAAHRAGVKLTAGSPYVLPPPSAAPRQARPVYVHSKLILVDDRYLSIGSANLATRAFRLDTEINLTLEARSAADRAHITAVAEQVLRHWNILPSENSSLTLREFKPLVDLTELKRSKFSWQTFFDPRLPWSYPLRRKLRWLNERPLRRTALAMMELGVFTVSSAWASAWNVTPSVTSGLLLLVLSTVWLVPVPFVAIALLASLTLEPDSGIRLALIAWLVAAPVGYGIGRIFPRYTSSRLGAPPPAATQLGDRHFESVLRLLIDPTISLRSKLAFQGVHTVPFPWFCFANLVVAPAALATFLQAILARQYVLVGLAALLLLSLRKTAAACKNDI